MIALVTGGSGSGKSAYAEQLVKEISRENRVYLATMRVWDAESERRVERHRAQRAELGFRTVECPVNLDAAELDPESTVLLEDISNLVANEMFDAEGDVERLIPSLQRLAGRCANLVMVGNDVFSDGGAYEASTLEYMHLLAKVNAAMAEIADCGIEVVFSIPVIFKGEKPCS